MHYYNNIKLSESKEKNKISDKVLKERLNNLAETIKELEENPSIDLEDEKIVSDNDNADNILDKCTKKRIRNNKFSEYIEDRVSVRNFENINQCGNFLQMISNRAITVKKLVAGNFCKNRFCPFCSWRKSMKDAMQLKVCLEFLEKEKNQDFYFLTLTSPNVSGAELNDEIKHYNASFKRLMERAEVKNLINGYVRKLEITYNGNRYITEELYEQKKSYYKKRSLNVGDLEPNYDTYHPHFHVIFSVNKGASKNRFLWINEKDWLYLWQEATRNSDITQVHLEKMYSIKEDKGVNEIAKYASKDQDYLYSKEVFNIFYDALKGKRVIVFSGLFKEAVALYKQGKLDSYKEKDMEEYVYLLFYNWIDNTSKYAEDLKRELTLEEYKLYNKNLIDEIDI